MPPGSEQGPPATGRRENGPSRSEIALRFAGFLLFVTLYEAVSHEVSLLEPIYVFISQFEIMNIYMGISRDGQGRQSRGSWPWDYSLLERGLFGNRSV